MRDFTYVGSELDLFAEVRRWKSYWSSQLSPFLVGALLEVGAGIGSNSQFLDSPRLTTRTSLEPDPDLVIRLVEALKRSSGRHTDAVCGLLTSIPQGREYDAIVYIDVIEHIEDDRRELTTAASYLRSGGHLIVLSPAHQFLFSPFDAAIGHFRRYNRSMLQDITPAGLEIERIRYLDSVGLLASAANRFFLRQSTPTAAQLHFWDTRIIPVSRILDRLLLYSLGKSIFAVWRKP